MSVIRRLLTIDVGDGRLKRAALGNVPVANVLVRLVGMALAMGLLQLWLSSLLREVLPLGGWHHAEEVPCGAQA